MPRRNSKKPLSLFQSAKPDAKEPFVQIGVTLMQSKAFTALSSTARVLYCAMLLESKGQFASPFPFTRMTAKRYGISENPLYRALKELGEAGFIKQEASNRHRVKANLYVLSLNWHSKATPSKRAPPKKVAPAAPFEPQTLPPVSNAGVPSQDDGTEAAKAEFFKRNNLDRGP